MHDAATRKKNQKAKACRFHAFSRFSVFSFSLCFGASCFFLLDVFALLMWCYCSIHNVAVISVSSPRPHSSSLAVLLVCFFFHFPSTQRDKWRRTPLHRAAKEGHKKTVGALLDSGAEINAQVGASYRPVAVRVMRLSGIGGQWW